MGNSFSTNGAALRAGRLLNQHASNIGQSLQRLGSGLRINSASDDAAGLAISSILRSDSRVFTQALRNGNDGISALSIADGALGEMTGILIRLRELATQAADGSYKSTQRKAIDSEAYQLTEEYNRIISTTTFNGINLLSANQGATRIQLGYGVNGGIAFTLCEELDRNVGTGSFSSSLALDANTNPASQGAAQSADLNGDGISDAVLIGGAGDVSIQLSNGNGTFTSSTLNLGGNHTSVTLGDFNGDGKVDLLTGADGSESVSIALGNGNGTFGAVNNFSVNVGIIQEGHDIVSADFNADGKLDFAFADWDSNNELRVVLGNGNGTFNSNILHANSTAPVDMSELALGDFNNDGIVDIAAGGVGGGLTILQGVGNGTFTTGATYLGSLSDATPVIGDYNHDGNEDILVGSSSGATSILTGNGIGQFTTSTLGFSFTQAVAFADINGDGYLDAIGQDGSGTLYTSLNNGRGGFASAIGTAGDTGGSNTTAITVGDYNNDGVTDVISATTGSGYFFKSVTTNATSIPRLDLLKQSSARSSFTIIDSALDRVLKERGKIGANLSRLGSAISNLSAQRQNSEAAASRITDADMAEESASLVRLQTLQQATSAVLVQANQSTRIALQLLDTD